MDKLTFLGSGFNYINPANGAQPKKPNGKKAIHPYLREGFVFKCCQKHLQPAN